jgi:pectin methylesterase-like acyl-CoA thioesterase
LFPAPGSAHQCPDPSLRLRFEATPALGDRGEVRLYDAATPDVVTARIDLSRAQITDTIGGASFNLPRPAYVDGDEVIFVLPAAGLQYGHSYFVVVDEGAVFDPDGNPVIISDPEAGRFQVVPAAPADRTQFRVALDGTGQFCSLQGALDAATTGTTIQLSAGAYYGVSYVTDKVGLKLLGAGRDTTRILGVNNNNLNPSTRGRALLGTEHLEQLTIQGVTIENLTPQGGSQAEALTLLSCDQCIVRDSTIISRQDTLLWSGRIYAEDSRVEGNVDYIWGTGAAYFNRVEVKTIGRSGYNVQARNTAGYGYVFVDARLTADPGIEGDVLARIDVDAYPSSHVAYIHCEMGPHIAEAGWTITGNGSRTGLRFWEYGSHTSSGAPIDVSKRAQGSRQLNAEEAAQMRDPAVVLSGWDPR